MNGLGCMDCGGRCGMGSYIGLGQDDGSTDSDGTPIDTGATDPTTTPLTYGPSLQQLLTPTGTTPASTPATVPAAATSSSLTPAEANLLGSIASAWTKIAGNVIAPQTTIQTPSGLQVSTPAGQTSALSSLFGGTSLLSSSSTATLSALLPWLLIGGAGLLAVKALGK